MKPLLAVFWGSRPGGFFSIRLISCVLLGVLSLTVWGERIPPGTDEDISERLEPVGSLCMEGEECGQAAAASASSGPRTGKEVYDTSCMACHGFGVSGAPKLGSAEDWAPRIAQGMDTLWSHTQSGFNVMPPRGTCMQCSDNELRAAMDYMVASAASE